MGATVRVTVVVFVALFLTTGQSYAQDNWKPGDRWKVSPRDPTSTIAMGPETMDGNGCFLPPKQCLKTLYEYVPHRLSTGWDHSAKVLYDTLVNECGHHLGVVHCFEKESLSSLTYSGKNIWKPWMKRNHVCRSGYIPSDKVKQNYLAALYKPTGRALVRYIGIDAELGKDPENAKACIKFISNDGAIFEQETVIFGGEVPWYPHLRHTP